MVLLRSQRLTVSVDDLDGQKLSAKLIIHVEVHPVR